MNDKTNHVFTMGDFNEYSNASFEKRKPIHELLKQIKVGCLGYCKGCTKIAVDKFGGKPYCDLCFRYIQGLARVRGGTGENGTKLNPLPPEHHAWDELHEISLGNR